MYIINLSIIISKGKYNRKVISMDKRFFLQRKLDNKIAQIKPHSKLLPTGIGWISTIKKALGMTSVQLAIRMNVSQPRIAVMEKNETNLKISTLKKAAEAMNCKLVYYFEPITSLEDTVKEQAMKKAKQIISSVNSNMALENQEVSESEILEDTVKDLLENNIKRIWE